MQAAASSQSGLAPPPHPTMSPYPGARPPTGPNGVGYLSPAPPPGRHGPGPGPPSSASPLPYPTGPPPPQGHPPHGYPAQGQPPPPGAHLSLPPASSVYPTPQNGPAPFPHQRKKRLVVCCDGTYERRCSGEDHGARLRSQLSRGVLPSITNRVDVNQIGTWLNADNSVQPGAIPMPSNVTRFGRAVKPESSDGITQVVFYQPGVGTAGGPVSRRAGGATGDGLAQHIREAYAFICLNYNPGDEIFLVGFSRGAFTARSVAGLVAEIGLLTKTGLNDLAIIFKDVKHRHQEDYISAHPDIPFHSKPSASSPKYVRELVRRGLTIPNIPIRAIGVWDTVGALGIPRVPWLERLGVQSRTVRDYTFYDTALSPNVENAFQALALDEHRSSFVPTLWEMPKKRSGGGGGGGGNGSDGAQPEASPKTNTILRQVWFPGVHSNVGGGYPDPGIENITLFWMISQMEPLLDFAAPYLATQARQAAHYYDTVAPAPQVNRPWSFGYIYNSLKGIYALAGKATRTPGEYTRIDPDTGRLTTRPLRQTCEYVHASVRARMELDGPSPVNANDDVYLPTALDGYTLRRTGNAPGAGPPAVWESKDRTSRRKGGGPKRVLLEAPLFATEIRLLSDSPEIQEGLFGRGPPPRRSGGGGGRPPPPEIGAAGAAAVAAGGREPKRRHRRDQSAPPPETDGRAGGERDRDRDRDRRRRRRDSTRN